MTDIIETRVQKLADDVERLKTIVADLARRVDAVTSAPFGTATSPANAPVSSAVASQPQEDMSEELLGWVGRASLLQRISAISFLLVIALSLRTITDKGILSPVVGSFIGQAYAALLIIGGWRFFRRGSPMGSTLSVCGALLFYAVVAETHARFDSLPTAPAYGALVLVGISMSVLMWRYKCAACGAIGTLGMCLAGVAIDFPDPWFKYTAGILVISSVMAELDARAVALQWLRWAVFAISSFVLVVWEMKIQVAASPKTPAHLGLSPELFLPTMCVLFLLFVASSYAGLRRATAEGDFSDAIDWFDAFAPSAVSALAFILLSKHLAVQGMSSGWLAPCGYLFAAAMIASAYAPKSLGGHPADSSRFAPLVFSGCALAAFSLIHSSGGLAFPSLVLSLLALFLSASERWANKRGTQFAAYLTQLFAAGAISLFLWHEADSISLSSGAALAMIVSIASFFHYEWFPGLKLPYIKRARFGSSLLLLASLSAAFFAVRFVVYATLKSASSLDLFSCFQSTIINASAVVLTISALLRRDKQMRNIAILVLVVGGFRVFFGNMLNEKGAPLLISISSFGLAAAAESMLLARWQSRNSSK